MNRVLECVPNFSEGRNQKVIRQIADALNSVEGATVLNVDPGVSTNRTVITLAGSPEAVVEAAFQGIKAAAALIDMRTHKGEHPRMGATDVCPFVPISGITVEEAVELANELAKRVGMELKIPVYLYEYAATTPQRRSLADIRTGEYEGFAAKILQKEWKPDYGPQTFNALSGQTVIGVREFLVAYNINLNTTSSRRANAVAFDIREAGRVVSDKGKVVLDELGAPLREPGKLKHCRAIGWYIDEYGAAQVSMNLTNIRETPVHVAFDAADESARSRGLRITGSELVGLVPLQSLLDAGRHYLRKQNRSLGVSEAEIVHIAVKSLGLDELGPFDVRKRVIEYILADADKRPLLVDKTVMDFCQEVARETAAPGGGSVAALSAALGASLGAMVANLSANKRGWEDRVPRFSDRAVALQGLIRQLVQLVDEDTDAFNKVMEAYRLPKNSESEKAAALAAEDEALKYAAETPLQVMRIVVKAFPHLVALSTEGNPNSISDIGVGAHALQAALLSASLNVRINLKDCKDAAFREAALQEIASLRSESGIWFERIIDEVHRNIEG